MITCAGREVRPPLAADEMLIACASTSNRCTIACRICSRGLVRHDRVGGGEQVALHLAVGVGRQAELRRVVDDLPGILRRGILTSSWRWIAMTCEARLPSGIVTVGLHQVLRVEQRGQREAGLHVRVQLVKPAVQLRGRPWTWSRWCARPRSTNARALATTPS